MIKQNKLLTYPEIKETQIVATLFSQPQVQQMHSIVQQIKTKFTPPPSLVTQPYPTSQVVSFFQNFYKSYTEEGDAVLASQEVVVKVFKNACYYGQMKDGMREGFGICMKNNKSIYEGMFYQDKKHGKGFELLRNDSFYYGHYIQGLPHGEGVFQNDQQVYYGQWQNGKKNGIGYCRLICGDYYLSSWESGKLNGVCFSNCNNDIFFGEVSNNLKHGYGEEYFENGDYFKGQYSNGKPNGQGHYKWANGNTYRGEFYNGLRNGEGVWQSSDDKHLVRYEGSYVNDEKCGQGVFHYANGTIYKGQFQNDKRNGYGEMTWPDGGKYSGHWSHNLIDGEGIYQFKSTILKGIWKNNQLQTYEQVRMGLTNFPITNKLKPIIEDEEILSKIAEEPDQDCIGEQFQLKLLSSESNISHLKTDQSRHYNYFALLKQQQELLSSQSQNIGIQTEIQQKYLPKLSLIKEKRNYSVDHKRFNKKISNHQAQNNQSISKSYVESNRSVQVRSRKHKECLLNKKEQHLWQIKMSKMKLSPKKYSKLWNPYIVQEIKQMIYPPVWKPPSCVVQCKNKKSIFNK